MNINIFKNIIKAFKFFYKNYQKRTIAIFLLTIVVSFFELISIAMILPLISLMTDITNNSLLNSKVISLFQKIGIDYSFYNALIIFTILYFFKIICEFLMNMFISYSIVTITKSFREKIIILLKNAKWEFFVKKSQGIIINILSQEVDKAVGVFNILKTIFVSFLMLIVYCFLGTTVSLQLLICAMVIAIIGYFIGKPMFQMASKAGRGEINSLRDLSKDLSQGLRSFKSHKAMAKEKELLNSLSVANNNFLTANLIKVKAQHLLHASQQTLLIFSIIAGLLVAKDFFKITFIEIGFMTLILMRLNAYTSNIFKKFLALNNNIYVLDKYKDFINELIEYKEKNSSKENPEFPNLIEFKNINFSYGEKNIFNKLNLKIPLKGLNLIIGESGTGKTTLIDLICGFHAPNNGDLFLDKQNFKDINIKIWRSFIGYVPQETFLLNKSIAENISLFQKNIDENKIEKALGLSGLRDYKIRFNKGINENVGEVGAKLSGGEKQRISIAKAISYDPKLLIMDEPTSSLDFETSLELMKTISQISKKIPVILISHQLKFKKYADKIIEL